MYKEIVLQELFQLQDPQYQKFQSSLVPGANNIIGVRVPMLRSLAKKLNNTYWQEYLEEMLIHEDQYYEETVIQGLIIASVKISPETRLTLIRQYIPKISNWAQCDIFCNTLKDAKKYPQFFWELSKFYCKTNSTYSIRFGVVMLLTYYTNDEYAPESLNILKNISHEDYYVKMAVAWAISIFYIKYPKLTLPIISNGNLDKFTNNKSIQKICESLRIKKEDKIYLKTLKR